MSDSTTRTVVVAECDGGKATRVSFEAIAAAHSLGAPVVVVLPGASEVMAAAREFVLLAVEEIVCLQHEALAVYTPDGFVMALAAFLSDGRTSHVVFPHSYRSRDMVPALASRLGRPAITDCTRVNIADGRVVLTRPMFRGKVEADVEFDGPYPHILTVQIGAFSADAVPRRSDGPVPVQTLDASVDASAIRQTAETPFCESPRRADLNHAERIVAVGRGIKSQEHLVLATQLASALEAEVAASRPVCDAGWLPHDRQVGSSGQTVAPALYLALGISGAIQHVVGMKGARTVVAINTDRDAPIFEVADYGIVADLFEAVPALLAALREEPVR